MTTVDKMSTVVIKCWLSVKRYSNIKRDTKRLDIFNDAMIALKNKVSLRR